MAMHFLYAADAISMMRVNEASLVATMDCWSSSKAAWLPKMNFLEAALIAGRTASIVASLAGYVDEVHSREGFAARRKKGTRYSNQPRLERKWCRGAMLYAF